VGSNAIETTVGRRRVVMTRRRGELYILNTRCLNGYSGEALTAAAAATAAATHSVGSTSKALQKNNNNSNNKIVIEGENSKSV